MMPSNRKYSAPLFSIGALFFLSLEACVCHKPPMLPTDSSDDSFTHGVVTNEFEKDGCAWLIQFNDGVEGKYLIPVQLEDEFKKNGLKIAFTFHYSRISQGVCQMGQPVVLEEIKQK